MANQLPEKPFPELFSVSHTVLVLYRTHVIIQL